MTDYGGHLDAGDPFAGGLDLAAHLHRAAGAVAGVGDDHGQSGEVVDDASLRRTAKSYIIKKRELSECHAAGSLRQPLLYIQ